MHQRLLPISFLLLIAIQALGEEADPTAPSPNIAGETVGETAARSRYSVEEIHRFFPAIETWKGLGIDVETMAGTFNPERFKAPPKPYTHPRVFFNAEDVPQLRKRMRESQTGQVYMRHLRARTYRIHPDPKYWKLFSYINVGKNPEMREEWLKKGVDYGTGVYGYNGDWMGDLWAKPALDNVTIIAPILWIEAMRCLIDEDDAGMKKVASVLTLYAQHFLNNPKSYGRDGDLMEAKNGGDWQNYAMHGMAQFGPLRAYDLAYNHMTETQRKTVRKAISDITRGKTYIGMRHLPAIPGGTSNWCPMMARLAELILCIEGEEGYDELVFQGVVEQMRKHTFVATGPGGALFEGLVKASGYGDRQLPLAKRGHTFIGTQHAVAHPRQFLLHTMLPWGEEHVFETMIAKGVRDIQSWKVAHPSDPVIDMFYGRSAQWLYKPHFKGHYRGRFGRLPYYELDPLDAKGDTYDWNACFDKVMKHLTESREPTAYYDDYRGLMTVRSGWDRDASFLFFEPRNVQGGHPRRSRNEFVFASHGRVWATRTWGVESSSHRHSVLLLDGKGGDQLGRTCAYENGDFATFATGDGTLAYRYRVRGSIHNPYSINESRLNPSPLPWMDMPVAFLPQWQSGKKGGERFGALTRHIPVCYAFRSTGMVQPAKAGNHAYALIVDNVRFEDDNPHLFQWQMMLHKGLEASVFLAGKALPVSGRPEKVEGDRPEAESSGLDDGEDLLIELEESTNRRTEEEDEEESESLMDLAKALVQEAESFPELHGDWDKRTRNERVTDILIKDPDPKQRRRLLVRILHAGGQKDILLQPRVQWQGLPGSIDHKLLLSLRGHQGAFKVMLYPHLEGDVLPRTRWVDDATLKVELPGQTDTISFKARDYGVEDITINRDGVAKPLVLSHPEKPLPSLEAKTAAMNKLYGERWHPVPDEVTANNPIITVLKWNGPHLNPDDKTNERLVKRYGDGHVWPTHPDWYEKACYGLSSKANLQAWLRNEKGVQAHSGDSAINLSSAVNGSYRKLRFVDIRREMDAVRKTAWGKGKTEQEIGDRLAAAMNRFIDAVFVREGEHSYTDFGSMWSNRQFSYRDGHLRVILSSDRWKRTRPVLDRLLGRGKLVPDYAPELVKGWSKGFQYKLPSKHGRPVLTLAMENASLLDIQDAIARLCGVKAKFSGIAPAAGQMGGLDDGGAGDEEELGLGDLLEPEAAGTPRAGRYNLDFKDAPIDTAYLAIARLIKQEPYLKLPRVLYFPIKRTQLHEVNGMTPSAFKALPASMMKRISPERWEAGKNGVGILRQVIVPLSWGGRHYLAVTADEQTQAAVAAAIADQE